MAKNYKINVCRICQISDRSDLIETSTKTSEGQSYLDLLKFIFNDIEWIEDELLSLACKECLNKIKEVAEFKTLCLETNRRRASFNTDTIKVECQQIKNENSKSDDEVPNFEKSLKRTEPEADVASILDENDDDNNNSDSQEVPRYPRRGTRNRKLSKQRDDELMTDLDSKRAKITRKQETKSTLKKKQVKRKAPVKKTANNLNDNDQYNDEDSTNRTFAADVTKEKVKDKIIWDTFEVDLDDSDTKALSVYIPQYGPTPLEDTCRKCKKKFSDYKALKEHVKSTHLKLRRYHCDSCKEGFISKDLLERHTYKHDGIRKHVCTICGSKYITLGDLRHHLDRHVEEAKYGCDLCPDKKYKTLNSLRSHKQLVHVERKDFKYLCTDCGKKFPQTSALKVHMLRMHGNVRDFTCHICQKPFFTKGELATHHKTHTNIRDYKCELCPAEYKHKDYLLLHQTKVHGIGNHKVRVAEKYECRYCSKIISSKDKLKRHIRIHTGIKPYKCKLCDMKFTCKSYVRCHVKRKHNIDVETTDFNIKSYCDVREEDFANEDEVGGNLLRIPVESDN